MSKQELPSGCIGKRTARKVADSQKDLGIVDQNRMIQALSQPHPRSLQLAAYELLDPLSQMIVMNILSASDTEEAESKLTYMISCLMSAREAIR